MLRHLFSLLYLAVLQVYTMRDLNPMYFFRGQAPDAKPDTSLECKDSAAAQKKPMTKVPSLLFDIEVRHCSPVYRIWLHRSNSASSVHLGSHWPSDADALGVPLEDALEELGLRCPSLIQQ